MEQITINNARGIEIRTFRRFDLEASLHFK